VAFTNRANSALVTGARSIQNPLTVTRCTGEASGMPQFSQPIQNVPPGTQTMPSGAGPGAGVVFTRAAATEAALCGAVAAAL
jgi:hypothetical protein